MYFTQAIEGLSNFKRATALVSEVESFFLQVVQTFTPMFPPKIPGTSPRSVLQFSQKRLRWPDGSMA